MFALYITHPQVAIDPAVPVPDWGLSERGRERAALAAAAGWAGQIGRFAASTERKAIETATKSGSRTVREHRIRVIVPPQLTGSLDALTFTGALVEVVVADIRWNPFG